jgi:hypothetical protein
VKLDLKKRRAIVTGLVLAGLIFGSFGTVYGAQSLKWERVHLSTAANFDTVYLPSHNWLRAFSLGYRPFAADVLWMRTHSYFLSHMYGDRILRWLDPYVGAVAALDPDLRDLYYWAAMVVRYGQIIDEAVIERSNRFAEMGIERFPDDSRLYAHLGFNKYFELRPKYRQREEDLLDAIEQMPQGPEREKALAALAIQRKRRYDLEQSALQDYTVAAMLPNSSVDPLFLITLYVKQDEHAAATSLTQALIVDAPPDIQRQLLYKLEEIGESELAERLRKSRDLHESEMPYVNEDLFRFLGSADDLVVPRRWNDLGAAYEKALESLEQRRQQEELQ